MVSRSLDHFMFFFHNTEAKHGGVHTIYKRVMHVDFHKFEVKLEFPASQGYLKNKQMDRNYGGGSVSKCLLSIQT